MFNRFIVVLIVVLIVLTTLSLSAQEIFSDDFESGDLSFWSCGYEVSYIAINADITLTDNDLSDLTVLIFPVDAKVTLPPAGSVTGRRIIFEVWDASRAWPQAPGCGFVSMNSGMAFDGLILSRGIYEFVAVPAFITEHSRWLQLAGPLLGADPLAPVCENVPMP